MQVAVYDQRLLLLQNPLPFTGLGEKAAIKLTFRSNYYESRKLYAGTQLSSISPILIFT